MTMAHDDLGEIVSPDRTLTELRAMMRQELSRYTRLTPSRTYFAIARQWMVIAVTATAAIWSANPWVYAVAIIIIATRQHALGVLGHEGSHYRITPHRGLNNFIADVFCWLPLSFNNTRYAYEHLLHHKYVNTDRDPYQVDFTADPQFHWPKPRRAAIWSFVQDVTGLHFARVFSQGNRWGPLSRVDVPMSRADKFTAVGFAALLLISLWLTGGWLDFALLWLLPLVTLTWWFVHWRTVAEHIGMRDESIAGTRNVEGNWWERLSFAPLNINYHLAHHLFPAVPWYHLPELHNRLLSHPDYSDRVRNRDRYFGPNSVWEETVY